MPDIPRHELVAYALAALLVVVLGMHYLRGDASRSPGAGASGARSSAAVTIARAGADSAVVDVAGAVRRPGVYRMAGGQRVEDAVRRAGGARRGADLGAINLAAKLADGQQIVVPVRGAASAAASAVGAAAAASAGPVSLNSATAEQLESLDGVGPATAQKILDYRRQHGGFRTVEDLGEVPGIGPKRLAALRTKVQV
jgi:competence protein ComEA